MEARVNELVREGHLLISARRIAELESIAAGATRVAEQAVFAAINVLIGDNLWYDPAIWRHLQELQSFSAAFELDKTLNHTRNAAQVCGPDLPERSHKDRIRETTTVHARSGIQIPTRCSNRVRLAVMTFIDWMRSPVSSS